MFTARFTLFSDRIVVCTNVGVLVYPADARPEYEICVHYDVDLTLHGANLPHIKKSIFHLLTILCRFMLAHAAVFLGNNAAPTTTPAPTISAPPTSSKRPIMSWTKVHGNVYYF